MLENILRKQFAADENAGGYGYGDDSDAKVSPFVFGLNAGVAELKKFEWTPTGGKDGAEQEALEIIFDINGTERGYRQFPVTKAFKAQKDGGGETTDPNSPEMKQAFSDFRAIITHILHAFVDDAIVKQALTTQKFESFKDYVNACRNLLPNPAGVKLDIFMEYQYKLRDGQDRTYLQIPAKRKHGAFLVKAQPGTWTAIKVANPDDNNQFALRYGKEETAVTNADGTKTYTEFHPFVRTGWYMNSDFAKQQRVAGSSDATDTSDAGAAMNSGTSSNDAGAAPTPPVASTW